jgi:hypothetical protein
MVGPGIVVLPDASNDGVYLTPCDNAVDQSVTTISSEVIVAIAKSAKVQGVVG